jgi:hypothetical protein
VVAGGAPAANNMGDNVHITMRQMMEGAGKWSMEACAKSFIYITKLGLILRVLRALPLGLATNPITARSYLFTKLEEGLPTTPQISYQ